MVISFIIFEHSDKLPVFNDGEDLSNRSIYLQSNQAIKHKPYLVDLLISKIDKMNLLIIE